LLFFFSFHILYYTFLIFSNQMLTHHPSDPHRLGHGPFRRRCLLKESLPHPGPVCRYAQPAQFRRPTRLIVTRCYYRVASGFYCHPRVSGNANGSNFKFLAQIFICATLNPLVVSLLSSSCFFALRPTCQRFASATRTPYQQLT